MGKLVYSMFTSLDGFISDADGDFGWAVPDEAAHRFANELGRAVGTYLYGRRMYETMVFWETAAADPDLPATESEWAELWLATDKVVYSTTLAEPAGARTRIEPRFDVDEVRRMTDRSERDVAIAGPGLAAHALRAGIVDELQVFVAPAVVGGGTPFLPPDLRRGLELVEERRFPNGMVFLRYSVRHEQ